MKKSIVGTTKDDEQIEVNIETENNYFSITGYIWEKNKPKTDKNIYICGSIHEEILEVFPNLKELIYLHLSDLEGIPMHAIDNGYYYYQIIKGIATYHTKKETDKEVYTNILSEHLRIDLEETEKLIKKLDSLKSVQNLDVRKSYFTGYVSECLPRWKKEAETQLKFIESL